MVLCLLVALRIWNFGNNVNEHDPEIHSKTVVSLGGDRYHAEVVLTTDGYVKLYTLDRDSSQVLEVVAQNLIAHIRSHASQRSSSIELHPSPQTGDAAGTTSCFSGELPSNLAEQRLQVTIPNLRIGGQRFHLTIDRVPEEPVNMPTQVGELEERELHLTPGGKYTLSDIHANGRMVPSTKYRGFEARHDSDPQRGEQLCPVTQTKANPTCVWVIGGQEYAFCCPPCIDEFVRLAKTRPEEVKSPETFVKQ